MTPKLTPEGIKEAADNYATRKIIKVALAGKIGCVVDDNEMAFIDGANYYKQNLWNKVEDGLPEKDGDYLTYNSKHKTYNVTGFCLEFERFLDVYITHWMYIPEVK